MLKVKNFTRTFLASAITSSQTSIPVVAGTGATFPTLALGDYTFATLVHPVTGLHEIVKIVDVIGDSFTVIRAQDDSSALAFPVASELAIQWNKQQVLDWTRQANAYTAIAPIVVTGQQISFANVSGLTPGTYANAAITIDAHGLITSIGTGSTTGYATETTQGLVIRASNAEVTAGLDDLKYVTPADITAKIAASGINGVIDLPGKSMTLGNGAIIKWGSASANNPSGVSGGTGSAIVTYAVPFPNNALAVWVSPRVETGLRMFTNSVGSVSSFTVGGDFDPSGSVTFNWIALGN
jgi:hypothetical protein